MPMEETIHEAMKTNEKWPYYLCLQNGEAKMSVKGAKKERGSN